MNILTAVSQNKAIRALFAKASLDLDSMLATGDDSALAAHLATLSAPAAAAAPAITAEHPEVAALITAAVEAKAAEVGAQVTALNARLGAHTAALATAGVKLAPKADSTPHTAAEITSAINDRVAIAAQQKLATMGVAQFPGATPAADVTKPAASKPDLKKGVAGLAQLFAADANG